MTSAADPAAVERYLRELQNRICAAFEQLEGGASFRKDPWQREEGGGGESRILEDGKLFERAGVNFSLIHGQSLPPAASARRAELAGRGFRAMGVSVVVHPRNPHAPTAHCNVRFLLAEQPGAAALWWFGGGFDLTPYYGYAEDARHWHETARSACLPFGAELYPRLKQQCDEYFYLPHRREARGIGGLFFDDLDRLSGAAPDFAGSFALTRSVGDHFLPAFLPIVERRRHTPHAERERSWQLYRRGRYVEFNLVQDRGTLFGLQSAGRTESILMSLPPLAAWRYDYRPEAGSKEAELAQTFLQPRDWLSA